MNGEHLTTEEIMSEFKNKRSMAKSACERESEAERAVYNELVRLGRAWFYAYNTARGAGLFVSAEKDKTWEFDQLLDHLKGKGEEPKVDENPTPANKILKEFPDVL